MQMPVAARTVDDTVAAIYALDLEPIKLKLMDREEGQGWSREYAERMEIAYRRYLVLLAKRPGETFAPTRDIDKFWHGHILDTLKYAEDCERVFGYFLHHFPYFGMRGEADAQALADASETMARLYAEEFGDPLPASLPAAYCIKAGPSQDAAYCIKSQDAAYCIKSQDAAYCIKSQGVPQDAAYCIKGQGVSQDAAYCIKGQGLPKDAAYCIRTKDAAYCIKSQDAAYCIKSQPKDAAYCIKSTVDTVQRPRLDAAA
jgi:hypothetical protein